MCWVSLKQTPPMRNDEISHITLPAWAVELVTRHGYMERFFHLRSEGMNSRQAYEQVEDELFLYFRTERYTSYASFLTSKRVWCEKKLRSKK